MELLLNHAKMLAIWFNLPDHDYKSLDLESIQAIVWLHFPEYRDHDITQDLKMILESIE